MRTLRGYFKAWRADWRETAAMHIGAAVVVSLFAGPATFAAVALVGVLVAASLLIP